MVSNISEVRSVVKKGVENPDLVFTEIKRMADNYDWRVREVAATALVEISKKRPGEILDRMQDWASEGSPNIKRVSIEGLRHIARNDPKKVRPVLEKLKTEENLYVRKSVASCLRNAGRKHPDFVLELCRKWARLGNRNTNWVIRNGLRKIKESHPRKAGAVLKILKE